MSKSLSPDELTALQAAHDHFDFGFRWKGKLKDCWMHSTYPAALRPYEGTLQHLRNTIGPTGLNRVLLREYRR